MNRLGTETSPYLQLHKDNPIDWYPWGPDAFDAAKAQNKPILLSIGYTACHWCHVMAQESFADPAIGAQLNENFICIKVDREERPDVDALYQSAANLMGHSGGWPLSMFLTAQGTPFVAGTYFPKEERAGQAPPFHTMLSNVMRSWREQQAEIETTAVNLMNGLNTLWRRDMRGPIDAGTLDSAALRIGQRFDIFFGGLGGAMKFPSVTLTDVLWRAYLRNGMGQFMQLTSAALDNMLLGGLQDHIGGGFSRYCVDERWLVPHWEKTLCDNAQIVDLLTSVWQFNRNKLCETRVAETVDFLLREMRNGAGFAASIDSDSEGEEGRYYTWTEAEIDAALMGTFVAKFKAVYNVSREGNMGNGRNILQRLGSPAPFPQSEADEALLARQRSILLRARQDRVAPQRDDKVLADWNGLTITALANAGAAFNRADWTTAAIEAFDFVVKALGDGDRLYHSWIAGNRSKLGFADDYAHMARAALALYEAVGEKRYLDYAKRWTRTLNEHYWDGEAGGYCTNAGEVDALIVRTRPLFDQPTPAANSMMIQVIARLMMLSGENEHLERLNAIIGGFAGEAQRVFVSMGSYFAGLEFAMSALHLVVVGPLNHAKTHELTAAILGRALPNKLLSVVSPDETWPETHAMHGKGMQNGQPTAYICQRGQCSAPIVNPVALSQMLQLPPQRPQPGSKPQ